MSHRQPPALPAGPRNSGRKQPVRPDLRAHPPRPRPGGWCACAGGRAQSRAAGCFRRAARAAGTGLPGDPPPLLPLWPSRCSGVARVLRCLPRGTPGALGRRRLSVRPSPAPVAAPGRESESGCRDSAPCVAGRGGGAPGMRARALAATSWVPLSRPEPPLAGQPPRPAPGHVSPRAARTLLRVSPASSPARPGGRGHLGVRRIELLGDEGKCLADFQVLPFNCPSRGEKRRLREGK